MKKAGELLGSFFDQSLMRSAQAYSEFFSAWKRIVGDHLAAHSRIVELEKTVLVVEADHPGWIQLIQMKRSSILESIRAQFPDLTVTAISIKLKKEGGVPARDARTERTVERTPPEESTEAAGASEAEPQAGRGDPYSAISDESFKDVLKRLEESIKKASR